MSIGSSRTAAVFPYRLVVTHSRAAFSRFGRGSSITSDFHCQKNPKGFRFLLWMRNTLPNLVIPAKMPIVKNCAAGGLAFLSVSLRRGCTDVCRILKHGAAKTLTNFCALVRQFSAHSVAKSAAYQEVKPRLPRLARMENVEGDQRDQGTRPLREKEKNCRGPYSRATTFRCETFSKREDRKVITGNETVVMLGLGSPAGPHVI